MNSTFLFISTCCMIYLANLLVRTINIKFEIKCTIYESKCFAFIFCVTKYP